jgi:hypothetical protein
MRVTINEARQNSRSAKIPYVRVLSCYGERLTVRSNLGDTPVLDGECLNFRASPFKRDNLSVKKYCVGVSLRFPASLRSRGWGCCCFSRRGSAGIGSAGTSPATQSFRRTYRSRVRSEKAPVRSSHRGTSSGSFRVRPMRSSAPLILLANPRRDTLWVLHTDQPKQPLLGT